MLSPASASPPPASPAAPSPVPSPREERKRTVWALISKEAPGVPSWRVQMRGLPFLSAFRRPSTSTLLPLCRYWLQVSAVLPNTETRNQIVSSTFSPALLVYWRLEATEKLVTGWPLGV